MQNLTHDLLLLMFNISKISKSEKVKQVFVEAINSLHPDFSIEIIDINFPDKNNFMQICTANNCYGQIKMLGNPSVVSPEFNGLLQNVVQMLAVALEKIQQDEFLANENKMLTGDRKKSEEKYRLIFENSPLGILSFDANGLITDCNDNFVKIIGSSRQALVGLNMLNLPDKNLVAAVQTALNGAQGCYDGVYSSVTAKKITPVRCCFAPINKENGQNVGGIGIIEDITERKQAERELKSNYDLLRIAGKTARFGGWSVDLSTNVVKWSDLVADIHEMPHGFSPQVAEAINFYAPEHRLKINKVFRDCAEKGIPYNEELQIMTKTGKRVWVKTIGTAVKNEQGKIIGVQGSFQDISLQKISKELLSREKILNEEYINSLPGVFYVFSENKFIRWNKQFEIVTGYSSDELKNMYGPDFFEEPDKTNIANSMKNVFINGEAEIEAEFFTKQGKKIPYLFSGVLKKLNGKPYLLGLGIDITERKQAENELRKSEEKFRAIFENKGTATGIFGQDMIIRECNAIFETLCGYPKSEIINKMTWADFVDKDDLEMMLGYHQQRLKNFESVPTQYECRVIAKGGVVREVIVNIGLSGEYRVVSLTDITERKRMEEKLGLTKFAIEKANDSIFLVNSEAKIIDVNEQAINSYGYSKEEFLSLTVPDFDLDYNQDMMFKHFQQVKDNKMVVLETHHKRKNGDIFPVQIRANYVKFAGDEYIFAFAHDITIEKEIEERIMYLAEFPSENPNPVMRINKKGKLLYANQGSRKLLDKWQIAVDGVVPENLRKLIVQCFKGNEIITFEEAVDHTMFSLTITPIKKADYVNVYAMNITQLKQVEEKLISSEEKYRTLFESMINGFALHKIVTDEKGNPIDYIFIEVNHAFEKVTGLKKENIIGKRVTEVLPGIEKDSVDWISKYGQVAQTGQSIKFESYSEEIKEWFSIYAFCPKKNYFAAIVNNISERKKTELALVNSEKKFYTAFNFSPIPISITTLDEGVFIIINEAMTKLVGYSSAELIGESILKKDIWQNKQAREEVINILKTEGRVTNFEINIGHKSGEIRECLLNLEIMQLEGKDCILSVILDVSERKKAEREALKARKLTEDIIRTANVMVVGLTNDGEIEVFNRAAERITGYTQDDLKGKNWFETLCPKEKYPQVWDEFNRLMSGGMPGFFENPILTKNGEEKYISWSNTDLKDINSVIRVVSFGIDRTEVKKLDEQLKQKSKELESLNLELKNLYANLYQVREEERTGIARELHDELGQALTALRMDASWVINHLEKTEAENSKGKLKSMIDIIDATVKVVQRISSDLRPGILDDLGLVSAIEWQLGKFRSRYEIVCDFYSEGDEIENEKYSTILFRIVQETLTNIVRHSQATQVDIELIFKEKEVNLKIQDNGIGIDPDKITDKNSLGLIGIRERVQNLNGNVKISGEKGKGTVIMINIPITA